MGLTVQVFRLPGIYGPGRSTFDRLREGRSRNLVKPGQVFSRIHVEDIASALEASILRPHAGRAYNLCDDEPAPPHVLNAFACDLMGVEPPPTVPYDETTLPPMARRFWSENKRVSNARAKAELGWRPAFASWREGLSAIYAQEKSGNET
jgi:nucleoside-diphosphate-sugar epimerase